MKRSWLGRLLVWFAEKMALRYYEGPEPPRRIAQQARIFAELHSRATVDEWVVFATRLGEECYRSGYMRGVERNVRDVNNVPEPHLLEAKRLADLGQSNDWVSLAPSEADVQASIDRNQDLMERLSPEDRILYMDRIGREMGGFRIALVDPRTPKAKKGS